MKKEILKEENNIYNKHLFLAHYRYIVDKTILNDWDIIKTYKLKLKYLKDITKDDLLTLIKIKIYLDDKSIFANIVNIKFDVYSNSNNKISLRYEVETKDHIDCGYFKLNVNTNDINYIYINQLQKLGYATWYNDLSIEDLKEYNWIE